MSKMAQNYMKQTADVNWSLRTDIKNRVCVVLIYSPKTEY